MKLHELLKTNSRSKKRVGRGLGSGKGKTSGRGSKGQKARGKVALGFIGGTLPLYKKLPFNRGIGNPKRSPKATLVPLSKLSEFKKGEVVDLQSLTATGIVNHKEALQGVKIVGNGEIKNSLTVNLPMSASAAKQIEKAGGKVGRE
ncbi:MAG: 50S ribosomal protein L15 [Candidatus Daviesbacteria bacterium]